MPTTDSEHAEDSSKPTTLIKATTRLEKLKTGLPTIAVAVLVVVSVVVSPGTWLPQLLHPGAGTLGPAAKYEKPIDLVKVAEDANREMIRQVALTQSTATARAEFAEQAFLTLQNSVREEKEREAREKRWRSWGMAAVTLAAIVLGWFTFRNPAAPDWAREVLKIAAGAIFAGWFGK